MWLRKQLIADVEDFTDGIFYVSMPMAKQFNTNRAEGTPMVFTGWYWARGALEAGPFKSKSAAYRDAWYRLVVKRVPPKMNVTYKLRKAS